jgi:hypothetical protein
MSNVYAWTITAMDCIPDLNGQLDYVVVPHWTCQGTDGTYTGQVYNTVTLNVDPGKPNYTPYADLTEAQVVGWVQEALGPDTMQAVYDSINAQIETQVNPTIVTPPLPWNVE